MAYKNFGDVVAFDTTYRTNRYAMPFVPFTGVNHHYQSILFGFALVRDKLKTTFEWVLSTWLVEMEGKEPLAIITDQDQAMAAAIESQLPNTSHLLCSWHISNKFPEKLATYYSKEGFKFDFNNCIYHSLTEVVFEDRWKTLILKYNLEGNTWLQRLYALKHKLVEAYTRNTSSACQKTTSRSEGMNAFFDAYVGSCTGLKDFVEGAQKALERQFMREKDEDYKTFHRSCCMQMKTALEHHAASIYTKEMFRRFQEQLVESSKYFGEKDRDQSSEDVEDTFYKCYRPLMRASQASQRTTYLVSFNKASLWGSCICRIDDHVGIPCRHIIAVLTKRCVVELPEHFVKRRWANDANRVDGKLPYHTSEVESPSHELTPTERFNHMILLTMMFSHSCMASKERYEYAVGVINRETEILESMPVDGVENEGGEMADDSDDESVSHVNNSISDLGEMCDSPTFSFLEEACRELDELAEMYEAPPYSEEMCDSPTLSFLEEACRELDELVQMYEPPPQSEEEDTELYPLEEAAYRSRNWTEASQWCASDNMFERVTYNLTSYFLPFLNLGKDYHDGPNKVSLWNGGEIVECDRIADIMKLRPRPGCTHDQMRIEYVKG
ncbi:protein FAR1-RELATED SEQUENCE 5-like [Daucus carota subsp. sativus]|uniref:protein FAR1-RELATED SEQUENCE 5-like n=1 Tax=Daucus carota subsp. sativus TaxID=79200 RepID=UPI0007F0408A|nr:PREDICTED: protein FAR1-RELATED SEQUENCE 5-like [Daucus carota subsp. sativus]